MGGLAVLLVHIFPVRHIATGISPKEILRVEYQKRDGFAMPVARTEGPRRAFWACGMRAGRPAAVFIGVPDALHRALSPSESGGAAVHRAVPADPSRETMPPGCCRAQGGPGL